MQIAYRRLNTVNPPKIGKFNHRNLKLGSTLNIVKTSLTALRTTAQCALGSTK